VRRSGCSDIRFARPYPANGRVFVRPQAVSARRSVDVRNGWKADIHANHVPMHMTHQWTKALLASLIALSVTGCRGGEGPFLQVQFCLTNKAGAAEFKRVLQAIARDEGLEFGDRSAETEAELRSLGNSIPPDVRRSFPAINVSVRKGNVGLGGGNLGLGPDQVSIGFGGPASPEQRAFAQRTLQRLQQTWELVRVPSDRGASRLTRC
jgi:hypothetical protein